MITLVIIGVVAALTIPNLMQKYQEQTTVKKVQKFYSTLANAYSLALKENGSEREWGTHSNTKEDAEKIYELLFKPYFKIAKNCGGNNKGNCLANVYYKKLDNSNDYNYSISSNAYKIVLDDGAAVFWSDFGNGLPVYYDVNGKKGPNQWGRDLFRFTIAKEKVYAEGTPTYNGASAFKSSCSLSSHTNSGYFCAAWVIYKGNMDYLHCNDLDWNGKDKCK